ncbi:MAG: hypothetical protein CMJ58_17025 [Planctomycetaceae bacterium]|nr:hypothetical protein [Planctomycetaceae bacterium]
MERRFVLFLTLSMLVLLANAWWSIRNLPKQPPVDPNAAAQVDEAAGAGDASAAGAENDADGQNADENGDDAQPGVDADGGDDENKDQDAADLAPEDRQQLQYLTLGSVDPDSPYRMLVTFTNQGAGVRRIELASPRYLDLHDLQEKIGYLGQLELQPVKGGLQVGVVGTGTPAEQAGLQAGDIITAAGAKELQPVATTTEFAKAIRAKPRQEVTLEFTRDGQQKTATATLARAPLNVIRPESENAALWMDAPPPAYPEPPSFLVTLAQEGNENLQGVQQQQLQQAAAQGLPAPAPPAELPGVDLRSGNWRVVEQTDEAVSFERRLPQRGLIVTKRYRLAEKLAAAGEGPIDPDAPAYHLMLEVSLRNEGDEPRNVAYQLDGANGMPVEGWWYATKVSRAGGVSLREVAIRHFQAKAPEVLPSATIATGDAEPLEGGSLAWAGTDAQYFSVCLIPQKTDPEEQWLERVEGILLSPKPKARSAEGKYANVTSRFTSLVETVPAGQSLTHEYEVFAGPKRPELLEQYVPAGSKPHSLAELAYYGWFGAIAKVMLAVLHFFYGFVGNYGVAIIMLTVLVRGLMFPISRSQVKSMVKMQELKPEMDKLKEKYKGDQQKQAQAMQELYRKHGVNPLAGCLPMFLQLPVFIGLYRGLAVDIELRQAPLFGNLTRWCSNLAAPDMFLDWSGFMPDAVNNGQTFIVGLGPYLNILPLITMALFMLQQKLFMPEPANEQAALQQKMMKYMMLVMGLLFYKVPSGLCLYFIASSLWGIAERKLFPPPTAATAGVAAGDSGPVSDRNGGRAERDRSGKRAEGSRDRKRSKGKKRR